MSKNNENKLLPKLRFPEFANDGQWESSRLGNVYNVMTTNSFSRDDLNYVNGNVKNIHYGDIHTKFSTLFDITKENVPFINENIPLDKFKQESYCKEGDMVFADASEDLKDVGKSIEIVNLNNNKLLSGLHTIQARQISPKLAIGFGGYLFLNEKIRKQIQREAQGAKVLGISATRLSNINIFYPDNQSEQKKIAACLFSLDEVITAESQKLEVLKDHKKGLLQILFPQAGETVPKFRFKEFENSGEWMETRLGDICKFIRGPFGGALKKEIFVKDGYAVYEQSHAIYRDFSSFRYFITEEKYNELKRFSVEPNDIIMSCSGTMGKFAIVPYNSKKGVINQALLKLTVKTGYETDFIQASLELPMNQNKLLSQSAGGAIKNVVEVAQIKEISISVPSTIQEQEKIADTLSSIDDLINAQNQKLETLQLHKKGLLQGLFPSLSETGIAGLKDEQDENK